MDGRMRAAALAFLSLAAFLGCRENPEAPPRPQCDRLATLDILQREYLWNTLLPERLAPEDYPSPEALLEDLVARARVRGLDRWSNISPKAGGAGLGLQASLAIEHAGYGAQFGAPASKLVLLDVIPGTGAARDGLGRGDEIVALAPSQADLDLKANRWEVLHTEGRFVPAFAALGSGSPQAPAWLRIRARGSGLPRDVQVGAPSMVSGLPLQLTLSRVIERSGRKVGYLLLRSFQDPAGSQLREAMGQLRQCGATDLIVDLRYNAGGPINTATLLLDHLNPGHLTGQLQLVAQPRPGLMGWRTSFQAAPGAIRPVKIAFITTEGTASASEAVINALQPYYGSSLAMVGQRTHGKPVGTIGFPLPVSGRILNLVTMRILNAEGHGDYFQGLPDAGFKGVFLRAPDDAEHDLGDPLEASMAVALAWILGEANQ